MLSTTPFLTGFSSLLGGRVKARIAGCMKYDGLASLEQAFGEFVDRGSLVLRENGVNSRCRSLPPRATFWAFLYQVFTPKCSDRDVVGHVDAWWHWSCSAQGGRQVTSTKVALDFPAPGLTPSAYCQARQRLDLHGLKTLHVNATWMVEQRVRPEERAVLGGRAIKIVDGTGISMPDTAANQAAWPQPASQAPGCGFPLLKMVGLTSLASGAILDYVIDRHDVHDSRLFTRLWSKLTRGDVVLGDRAFCSYATLASLAARGVDVVMRLHQRRDHDMAKGKPLGEGDCLVTWLKPTECPEVMSAEEFAALPATLTVRLIKVFIQEPGSRTREVTLVTTLLDPVRYLAETLRNLYVQRWQIELTFAHIKTTMGMDVLRCKSPAMVEKELAVHIIGYNLIRSLMQQASHHYRVPLGRISFKGSLDAARQRLPLIQQAADQPRKQDALITALLVSIAGDLVPDRPGRREPRAVKRRPKSLQLLTKPRAHMRETPHRSTAKVVPPNSPLT